jgi:hypothetical protein
MRSMVRFALVIALLASIVALGAVAVAQVGSQSTTLSTPDLAPPLTLPAPTATPGQLPTPAPGAPVLPRSQLPPAPNVVPGPAPIPATPGSVDYPIH